MRKFISDTFAMIIFSTIVGMIIEMGIIRLTIGQSVNARILAILINLLTGGIQGIFYDFVFKFFKIDKKIKIQKNMGEIIAFTLFQIPINILILLISGANNVQIKKSGSILIISSIFISKIYSILLKFFRKIFKVE